MGKCWSRSLSWELSNRRFEELCKCCEPVPLFYLVVFKGSQLPKMKNRFLTFPCYKIYREEAVGVSISNYILKITNFVSM